MENVTLVTVSECRLQKGIEIVKFTLGDSMVLK